MNNAVVYEYYSYGSDSEDTKQKLTTKQDENESEMGSKVKKKMAELGFSTKNEETIDEEASSLNNSSADGELKFKGEKAK